MGNFIGDNSTWIAVLTAIVLTMIIKISSKPEYISLNKKDFLDFGFDLSISSIILVLTEIGKKTGQASSGTGQAPSTVTQPSIIAGIWILMISFVFLMSVSIFVNRMGWDKKNKEPNLWGIIFPDILGIVLLIVATLYVGGKIL